MQALPHHYTVAATSSGSSVELSSNGLQTMTAAPPAEFNGPGDLWSPETLLMGALSCCLILTFKAVAAAAGFEFESIACTSTGELDRKERVTKFTAVTYAVNLELKSDVDHAEAEKLLARAEAACLISNSLDPDIAVTTTTTISVV